MNRWGRIVLVLAALATAAWILSAWLGRGVSNDATLARHTLVAFSALLVLLLTHGWIAGYLLLLRRKLPSVTALQAGDARRLEIGRSMGVVSAAAAVASAVLLFTVSNALYPARLNARSHAAAAIACSLVLIAALALEGRALLNVGRLCRRLDP